MLSANTYWRDRLPRELKRTYDSIARGFENMQDKCPVYTTDGDLLMQCVRAVSSDNPQFFWVSPQYGMRGTSRSVDLTLSRLYGRSHIAAARRACDNAANAVRGKTPLETEKNIVDYIVRNVTYEVDNMNNQNAASALYNGRAQCSGISAAVKYMCDKNGIWCIIVTGTLNSGGRAAEHAWNIVCLNGKYYHLDVTNTLGANLNAPQNLRYLYVNYPDSQMPNHAWDRSTVPACTDSLPIGGQSTAPAQNNTQQRGAPAARQTAPAARQTPRTPAQNGGTRQSGTQTPPPGMDVYTNMSQLRVAIKDVLSRRQPSYTFALTAGATVDERMKLIMSSVKMVAQQLNISVSINLESDSVKNTVRFEY